MPGRWVVAGSLRVGDVLFLISSCEFVEISQLTVRHGRCTVYNVQVEERHNYAVGTAHVLVHNKPLEFNPNQANPHALHEGLPPFAGDKPKTVGNVQYFGANDAYLGEARGITSGGPAGGGTSTVPRTGVPKQIGGVPNPDKIPGLTVIDYTHVEVQVVVKMRSDPNIKSAIVWINNPNGPCPGGGGCGANLGKMLLPGQKLTVKWRNAAGEIVSQEFP